MFISIAPAPLVLTFIVPGIDSPFRSLCVALSSIIYLVSFVLFVKILYNIIVGSEYVIEINQDRISFGWPSLYSREVILVDKKDINFIKVVKNYCGEGDSYLTASIEMNSGVVIEINTFYNVPWDEIWEILRKNNVAISLINKVN